MLIGNRWVENTRLKILSADSIMSNGVWTPFAGSISTSLEERGVLVGLKAYYGAAGFNQEVWLNLEFNTQVMHEGYFRVSLYIAQGYVQPTQMEMPHLDVPSDTEVTVSGRLSVAPANIVKLDLYMIAYYLKDFEAAAPVCFPTSGQPLPCV